jgi:hypothetical protein
MSPKLRFLGTYNPLRPGPLFRPLLGTKPPHITYANLEFGTPKATKDVERLLDWIGPVQNWSDNRVVDFLKKNQESFRRCVDWLASGSNTHFELANEDTSDDFDSEMTKKWKAEPEVEFFQVHGLNHAGVFLEPYDQNGSSFAGIRFGQREPRDPLDPLCWYLLSLLMLDGTLGVRRCRYAKCRKYFRLWSERKIFCDDKCRSNSYAAAKPLEDKRNYMRNHRAKIKRLRAVRLKHRIKRRNHTSMSKSTVEPD